MPSSTITHKNKKQPPFSFNAHTARLLTIYNRIDQEQRSQSENGITFILIYDIIISSDLGCPKGGYNPIQQKAWFVLLTLIHWIVIYPVESVIQPLNHYGTEICSAASKTYLNDKIILKLTFYKDDSQIVVPFLRLDYLQMPYPH